MVLYLLNEVFTKSSFSATKSATGLMEFPDVSTALNSLMLMNHAVVRNEGNEMKL
jgi:hypothetical protein